MYERNIWPSHLKKCEAKKRTTAAKTYGRIILEEATEQAWLQFRAKQANNTIEKQ